jgi:fructokinase
VKNANSTWLIGQPLQADLQACLRREVRIANDANCFALSEATDGAGRDAGSVFGIIIGTGTGGGLSINKHIIEGANAIAGEWGHNPLPWPQENELPGRACYCGKHGCIETWLSGPGLAADYRQAGGEAVDAQRIAARALEGEELAQASLQAYEDRMARATAVLINILDPEVIVLGGGLSHITRLYENVPRRWKHYVFSDTVCTRLLPPVHGDASGVRGAAWLWDE